MNQMIKKKIFGHHIIGIHIGMATDILIDILIDIPTDIHITIDVDSGGKVIDTPLAPSVVKSLTLL